MFVSLKGHLGLAGEGTALEEMLASHPAYMEAFLRFHHVLMNGDGPLPDYMRHYIAMMVRIYKFCCRAGLLFLLLRIRPVANLVRKVYLLRGRRPICRYMYLKLATGGLAISAT